MWSVVGRVVAFVFGGNDRGDPLCRRVQNLLARTLLRADILDRIRDADARDEMNAGIKKEADAAFVKADARLAEMKGLEDYVAREAALLIVSREYVAERETLLKAENKALVKDKAALVKEKEEFIEERMRTVLAWAVVLRATVDVLVEEVVVARVLD